MWKYVPKDNLNSYKIYNAIRQIKNNYLCANWDHNNMQHHIIIINYYVDQIIILFLLKSCLFLLKPKNRSSTRVEN